MRSLLGSAFRRYAAAALLRSLRWDTLAWLGRSFLDMVAAGGRCGVPLSYNIAWAAAVVNPLYSVKYRFCRVCGGAKNHRNGQIF